MKKKRTRYNMEFKAKVAIEAMKEQKTINEIAGQYQIHPNQVTIWKNQYQSLDYRTPAEVNSNNNQQVRARVCK